MRMNDYFRTVGDLKSGAERPFHEVAIDFYFAGRRNGAEAYRLAGGTAKSPSKAFNELLRWPDAVEYYERKAAEFLEKVEERKAALKNKLESIVGVDASEYMDVWRGACRHCHGIGHAYQYRVSEWDEVMRLYLDNCEKAERLGLPVPEYPDQQGGVGYNKKDEPHEDCPQCDGDGLVFTRLKPTKEWSPVARAAFAGIKQTKDGIEIKTLDVKGAADLLAKLENWLDKHQEAGRGVFNFHFDELDSQA